MKKSSIFRILLLHMLGGGVFGSRGTWNSSGAFEYYASPGGVIKSYSESESFCTSNGGKLAIVKSEDVQNFIETLVTDGSGAPYAFYFGLRDVDGDGMYHWNDGASLTYKNWGAGEPNNIDLQRCVVAGTNYEYKVDLQWDNQKCTWEAGGPPTGFVCQRKLDTTTQETVSTEQFFTKVQNATTATSSSNGTQNTYRPTETYAHTTSTPESSSQQTVQQSTANATIQTFATTEYQDGLTETNPDNSATSSSLLIPLAGAVGGVFIFILIIVAISWVICRRKRSKDLNDDSIELENMTAGSRETQEGQNVRKSTKRKKVKKDNATVAKGGEKPSSSTDDTILPPPPSGMTLGHLEVTEEHEYAAVVMPSENDAALPPPPEEALPPPPIVEEEGYSAIDLTPETGAVQESEYTSMEGLRAEAVGDAGYSKLNREGSVQITDTTYAIMAPGPLSTPTDVKPMEVPNSGNSYDILRGHEKQLDDPESVYSLADQPPQQIVQPDEPHIVEVPASPQTDESAQGNDPPMYAVVIKNSVKQ